MIECSRYATAMTNKPSSFQDVITCCQDVIQTLKDRPPERQ
ncbi:hypothetical protein BN1088_1430834 [Sphingobacterium sp. PM2-P1-29]|nr:hypothetical protein BN1088_1430834 [Sphingobacterium sp. PM2-P1-29]